MVAGSYSMHSFTSDVSEIARSPVPNVTECAKFAQILAGGIIADHSGVVTDQDTVALVFVPRHADVDQPSAAGRDVRVHLVPEPLVLPRDCRGVRQRD